MKTTFASFADLLRSSTTFEEGEVAKDSRYFLFISILLVAAFSMGFRKELPTQEWMDENVRINQIQVLGSHNSYKLPIYPAVLERYAQLDPEDARALDYSHAPLADQLDLGLRQLEIDVHYDPLGGLYANPLGEKWAKHDTSDFDSEGLMAKPGFKVFHKSDVDYRSHCPTFRLCLEQIKAWSDAHPLHLPIAIAMNAKDKSVDVLEGHAKPILFDKAAFQSLEKEVLDIIPRERIITPAEVYSDGPVRYSNWPTIGAARGKFVFMLDEPLEKTRIYTGTSDNIKDKLIFVAAPEGSNASGYTVINNALKHGPRMERLVQEGWLMRTLSEQGTVEPRQGDYRRARASFASGAQYISTDYYFPESRFGKIYHIPYLPGGRTVRCNPVNAPKQCNSGLLDPYVAKASDPRP